MNERAEMVAASVDPVGLLTREIQARLLNFSPSGCLIETNTRLDVDTIGSLRFLMDGRECVDDVRVVRCRQIEGAGSLYHVGARFLWTTAAGKGTLRRALRSGGSPDRRASA